MWEKASAVLEQDLTNRNTPTHVGKGQTSKDETAKGTEHSHACGKRFL